MRAKVAVVGSMGLTVFAAAVIAGSDTASEAPPPASSGQPADLDGLLELALVPVVLTKAVLDHRVNDVPIAEAKASDVSAAIARAGCSETRRESEEPVLVVHIDCAGNAATVTFVAEGALAPDALDHLLEREVGGLIRVGGAMLAVRSERDDSSVLLGKLQGPAGP